ncbi:hypothetical protein M758_3G007300 [Ceratodon purpureus]|uniref:Uncharacterized protein n=1 Tax=Ceratodon purpureus TaxID=3225 RepID=A0A8T0IFW9_CERPU|nr:hypothetical protein KC19_3G009500 [Ceratodon purpureus]KAG0621279.1 hypothetical protein M758_3G007300 [Ceratodon purpureus]
MSITHARRIGNSHCNSDSEHGVLYTSIRYMNNPTSRTFTAGQQKRRSALPIVRQKNMRTTALLPEILKSSQNTPCLSLKLQNAPHGHASGQASLRRPSAPSVQAVYNLNTTSTQSQPNLNPTSIQAITLAVASIRSSLEHTPERHCHSSPLHCDALPCGALSQFLILTFHSSLT